MPTKEILRYVRSHIPKNVHFWLTKEQLKLLALNLLDRDGFLDPNEASILRSPYFGQIYGEEGGDITASIFHFIIDVAPGVSYLSYLSSAN